MRAALAVALLAFQFAGAQPVPNSWSSGASVQIPTGGVKINGMFFGAAGDAPHPTMIYLHGLPGFAGDLDLPLPISRSGWNVLTLHYRGSWGNPGDYSYAHQIEDAAAAIAFVRDAANARRYSIDTRHIVLTGHSTGGLIAMITAAGTPAIEGLVLISASDDSAEALNQYRTPASRDALRQSKPSPCTGPLSGCTSQSLDLETLDLASSWSFAALAPRLTKVPILMITANDPYASENDALAAAIVSRGGARPIRIHLNTDHAYSEQRTALANDVIDWLRERVR
ncbi:MAG TPA: alpha/beta hydrolase [Bryobacteraceae bacterium]|nr:alpha/beta hydrolase [Bryobacteraceae bacterium]